jgi:integrase
MPLTALSHDDIVVLLRGIADRPGRHASGRIVSGGPHAARKCLAHLRGMLRWAAFNWVGGLQSDPSAAISAKELLRGRSFKLQRDRVLEDVELRAIWRAAERSGYPFGSLILALVLTGQRLSEIAEMRWDEIDGVMLLIPPQRMKNQQAHALPLTARMQKLLGSLPRFDRGDFVFTTTYGARPISGHSKYKAKFDKAMAEIGPVDHWQLHDLRRTVRTGLSRAGVLPFHAELVVAHQQSGVHGVYDRHRYDTEKLDALKSWEDLLFGRILKPPSENVVRLPERVA